MRNRCCQFLDCRLAPLAAPNPRIRILIHSRTAFSLNRSLRVVGNKRRFSRFKQKAPSSQIPEPEVIEDKVSEESVKSERDQSNRTRKDWFLGLRKVMVLWIASFWLVGSWMIPFLAHTAGSRRETLNFRGQALYSLLTDVAGGLPGIAILHCCLARFRPLPSDWFKFSLKGKWQFDVGLGCLMFPLVNRLSKFNLNLLPALPSTPVTVANVEQSIVTRDHVAMALYAVVVLICVPIWEEIVFCGFLLPSLTKYMPVWCSVFVSSIAFSLAHFNIQRMLLLVLLGVVMGTVFTRSRNLLASIFVHSLWNGFVFLDLMR